MSNLTCSHLIGRINSSLLSPQRIILPKLIEAIHFFIISSKSSLVSFPISSLLKYKTSLPFLVALSNLSKDTPHFLAKPSPALVISPSLIATLIGGPNSSVILSCCLRGISLCRRTNLRGVYRNSNSESNLYSFNISAQDFSIFFKIFSRGMAGSSSTPISIKSDFVIFSYPNSQ